MWIFLPCVLSISFQLSPLLHKFFFIIFSSLPVCYCLCFILLFFSILPFYYTSCFSSSSYLFPLCLVSPPSRPVFFIFKLPVYNQAPKGWKEVNSPMFREIFSVPSSGFKKTAWYKLFGWLHRSMFERSLAIFLWCSTTKIVPILHTPLNIPLA